MIPEDIYIQQRRLTYQAPPNDVGDAVRWVFDTRDENERTIRYNKSMHNFKGSLLRGELKIWCHAVSHLTPIGDIRKRIYDYYFAKRHEEEEEKAKKEKRKKSRKGPGFEFL